MFDDVGGNIKITIFDSFLSKQKQPADGGKNNLNLFGARTHNLIIRLRRNNANVIDNKNSYFFDLTLSMFWKVMNLYSG